MKPLYYTFVKRKHCVIVQKDIAVPNRRALTGHSLFDWGKPVCQSKDAEKASNNKRHFCFPHRCYGSFMHVTASNKPGLADKSREMLCLIFRKKENVVNHNFDFLSKKKKKKKKGRKSLAYL